MAGSDRVIGDRAYGNEAGKVAAIANAIAAGLQAGVSFRFSSTSQAMVGQMRIAITSFQWSDTDRKTLEETDFAAFRALASLPLGMTAHVVFTAFDPVAPATTWSQWCGK